MDIRESLEIIENKMSYETPYKRLIASGFSAGIPFTIGIITGIEPTKNGISLFIAQNFCSTALSEWTKLETLNCDGFFIVLSIVALLTFIWSLWKMVDSHDSYEGWYRFLFYFIGFIIAFFVILFSTV